MALLWVILIIVGILVLVVIWLFNSLIRLKNQVENAWAQIDVQLKRRADLIPNLIETVKGYMKHEKEVLENVTKARTSLMNAKGVEGKAKADNMLEGTLKTLFAVSENYPQLRANENFIQLQEELTGTENKISYARQHYNDMVMELNTKIQVFPSSIIAGIMNFKEKEMFEATDEEKKNIKVKF
ncbi:MAG TPA: LemA family protein [Candidatus Nanoarchaeia archaeon]|nr:LemA family protein [Candidatus Nanoarchaeia archaeon]